ncbi:hypothetical protein ES705_10139 [subsurface metagenome]
MKSLRSGEAGQALVMALILLALGAVLVVPTLNFSFTSIKYHELIEGKTLESYSADSGVKYALCMLSNNPNTYHDDPLVLDFTINDRAVKVIAEYLDNNVYKIRSVATSANGKSTTIECCASATSGLFQHAAVSNGKMLIADSTIDSAPVAGEADIFCNGDFVLHTSTVNGDVTYTGALDMDEYSVVTGDGPTLVAEGEELPLIDTQFWLDKAQARDTHSGNYWLQDAGAAHLGPLYITGNLLIQNSNVILDGTVYVAGTIKVQQSVIVGSTTLIGEGKIQLQTAGYDTENIPIIMSVNDEIIVQANSLVGAVLYAPSVPNGKVTIQDNTQLYGSAVGYEVTVQGSTITYVAEVQVCEGLPGSQINIFTYSY